MTTVNVRSIVHDVEAAIGFYTVCLGFQVELHPAPSFARLARGSLKLLLNSPGAGGAGQALPDGTSPEPGGWNRFQLVVSDLAREVTTIKQAGGRFRTGMIAGQGGRQALLEDPSGNLVELFEPYPDRT